MADKSRRPLQIPAWQRPYMEKHRIYDLFHELTRELIIQQPEDHVQFLKQILLSASQNRDNARVIIICPLRTNCVRVAHRIAITSKQVIITKKDLETYLGKKRITETHENVAKGIANLVRRGSACAQGWILIDCVRTEAEARSLLKLGVLPTHVLILITKFNPDFKQLKYCNVPKHWPEYRRQILGIRDAFKDMLYEIHLKNLTAAEVANECLEIINIKKGKIAITPRVVLIGPRGSGRKTQAKMLVQNLNLVHLDFDYMLCQTWKFENDISKKLRECTDQACFHPELLVQIVNKRVLEPDCISRGWVLTGYPYNSVDLQYLDCMDTPPNRVIFMECDLNVCRDRVVHNKVDIITGSTVNLLKRDQESLKNTVLMDHPQFKADVVDAEHAFYCGQYQALRKYCGGTSNVVNADQNYRWVHECIAGIIVRANNSAPPRRPFETISPSVISTTTTSLNSLCHCVTIPEHLAGCMQFGTKPDPDDVMSANTNFTDIGTVHAT